jgi:hypothetical protein
MFLSKHSTVKATPVLFGACDKYRDLVPEVRSRGPLQSQTGQVHSCIDQQEEDGYNAGDGVQLPCEQHQLQMERRVKL